MQDQLQRAISPSWNGYVHSVDDAILLISAAKTQICSAQADTTHHRQCGPGNISMIARRLSAKDRPSIHSGAVFVFEEKSSGIHRWTDKLMWSPSRQIGDFFVYRQMNIRVPRGTSVKHIQAANAETLANVVLPDADVIFAEKPYVGSLTSSSIYARTGLVKKTLVLGTYHVISYFTLDDVMSGLLQTPTSSPDFLDVDMDRDLLALTQGGPPRSSESPSSSYTDAPTLRRIPLTREDLVRSTPAPTYDSFRFVPAPMHLQEHTGKPRSTSLPTIQRSHWSHMRENASNVLQPDLQYTPHGQVTQHMPMDHQIAWSSQSSSPLASRASPLPFPVYLMPSDGTVSPSSAGFASSDSGIASWPSSYNSTYMNNVGRQWQVSREGSFSYGPPQLGTETTNIVPMELPPAQAIPRAFPNALELHMAPFVPYQQDSYGTFVPAHQPAIVPHEIPTWADKWTPQYSHGEAEAQPGFQYPVQYVTVPPVYEAVHAQHHHQNEREMQYSC